MKKFKKVFDTILRILVTGLDKLAGDNVGAYSAQAAFFLLTSIFPFLMLFLSLLQFFPFGMEDLIAAAVNYLPGAIEGFIVSVITEIYDKGTPALISVAVITTLWSASTGVNAVVRGLSRIFDANKTETWLKLRLESILYMLGLIIVIILSLGLSVFGSSFVERILEFFPRLQNLSFLSQGVRLVCSISLLTLIFDLVYLLAPLRKSNFIAQLPGALVSAVGWVGFSFLYSFYVDNLANFSVYGSLAAVVLFMLWMYVCFYILFIGAEINVLFKSLQDGLKAVAREIKAAKDDERQKLT